MAELDRSRMPRHIAIILDGNGRWANARGLPRTVGHAQGEPVLFDVIETALDLGVEWLTAYVFSTENWSRSDEEVAFLMEFNKDLLRRRRDDMNGWGVRIRFVGDRDDPRVPDSLRAEIAAAEELTATNTTMHLLFAFNYGSRREIADAARALALEAVAGTIEPGSIDMAEVSGHLYAPDAPDPDLVIRTSGEQRLSNFLMWQAAYSELIFTDVLWPDFSGEVLRDCIAEYQTRTRRFGSAEEA
ncbi:MAG: di-trans,poly-cis-decaprenylcistransferase [Acidimicrobiia bacterium]|nr:di-trans,poly-cis-decaprenylcistransferase [Acidimicrobiia bacterium]